MPPVSIALNRAGDCTASRTNSRSSFFRAQVPTKGDPQELWLLGDTHGQLNDVLWLFHEHGKFWDKF